MAVFNNNWIYTLDTGNPGTNIIPLPEQWKDPVTGISYSSLHLLSESELNTIGWFRVLEERPVGEITKYQNEVLDSLIFTSGNSTFTATYLYEYKTLQEVRVIKILELEALRKTFIETQLNNIPDIRKWVAIYKTVGKLISHLSPLVPAIQNDTYLQAVLNKVTSLNTKETEYDDKVTLVNTETNIPTIIAI